VVEGLLVVEVEVEVEVEVVVEVVVDLAAADLMMALQILLLKQVNSVIALKSFLCSHRHWGIKFHSLIHLPILKTRSELEPLMKYSDQ